MKSSATGRDDLATLAALGVIVACVSAAGHEALGHGGACLLAGGEVTLLTATRFACDGGALWVDAAGPTMNLLLAVVSLWLLRRASAKAVAWRWLLFLMAAVNIAWFAGEVISSPFMPGYDEAAIASQLGWSPTVWQPAMLIGGVLVYAVGIRMMAAAAWRQRDRGDPADRLRSRFAIPFAAAALSFTLAGTLRPGSPIAGAVECFLTIGVAALPMWLATGPASRATAAADAKPVQRSIGWIAVAAIVYAMFLLFQARGIGRLA